MLAPVPRLRETVGTPTEPSAERERETERGKRMREKNNKRYKQRQEKMRQRWKIRKRRVSEQKRREKETNRADLTLHFRSLACELLTS